MKFQIQHLKEASSTNTLVRQFADEGAKEGLVLVADYQTQGRGKPGRQWISPPGKNLLFSLLLRPPVPPSKAPLLTQIACRSVAKVLKNSLGIDSTFKRPNDILVQGKKICGVLVETASGSNGKLQSVVVGIGLNVNADSTALSPEAISIKEIKGQIVDRQKLLDEILFQLKNDIQVLYANPA